MDSDNKFSTVNISAELLSKIVDAIRNKGYGSVEIYVENFRVVQITERKITKLVRADSRNERLRNGESKPKIHLRIHKIE